MMLLGSLAPTWPPALRAFALTAVVVPVTVYLSVPRLLVMAMAVEDRIGGRRPAPLTEQLPERTSLPRKGAFQ
jgi:hypothetical protein